MLLLLLSNKVAWFPFTSLLVLDCRLSRAGMIILQKFRLSKLDHPVKDLI